LIQSNITFDNGYTVSVQFGPGNYCDNYDRDIGLEEEVCGKLGSTTAECAIFHKDGVLIEHPSFGGDTVSNRSTPSEVLELLNWTASQ